MEPLGVRGTLLKMNEFGRNGLWGVSAWTAMATINMTTILFVLQTFLVHFAAVAFAYIEEYRRSHPPPPHLPPDKTVVWTRIYRCVFDDSENALVWTGPKGMEISKILG